ncbi:MAG TPA: DMT family protein [Gemmataceae bacterium]|nr:DMT family protein [Gemmataceae bacterium]
MRTVILLILSNLFMTVAWYGHLKFRHAPLLVVILLSWLIALPEYSLQVPANRIGYGQFTAPQLKIIQEAISITVFVIFSILYLREVPTWRAGLAFLLIFLAVAIAVYPGKVQAAKNSTQKPPSAQRPVPPQSGQGPLEVGG